MHAPRLMESASPACCSFHTNIRFISCVHTSVTIATFTGVLMIFCA